ncbi:aminoacyl tRNA synthase complex-interacting multifunctional protein 2 [Cloeon dipterum]|uniref:aminoacyl tRNA synthase complex-interacting multifunctional protein 2 n=1 Tax=Cloeon dipterum TaxID=197152 RepID=UPI00321F63D9
MATMYELKPIFVPDDLSDLPTCMYRLKNLHTSSNDAEVINAPNRTATQQCNGGETVEQSPEIAKLEAVQEDILQKLSNLISKLDNIKKLVKEPKAPIKHQPNTTSTKPASIELVKLADAAVTANPSNPPYGLLALRTLWSNEVSITLSTHAHSTLKYALPKAVNDLFNLPTEQRGLPVLNIRVIWADVKHPKIVTSPACQIIYGEVNILRLLSRFGPTFTNIDSLPPEDASAADQMLDSVHGAINGQTEFINKLSLEPSGWLLSRGPSIVDVAHWSYFKGKKSARTPSTLSGWSKSCEKHFATTQ